MLISLNAGGLRLGSDQSMVVGKNEKLDLSTAFSAGFTSRISEPTGGAQYVFIGTDNFEQVKDEGAVRTLGFCCSQEYLEALRQDATTVSRIVRAHANEAHNSCLPDVRIAL